MVAGQIGTTLVPVVSRAGLGLEPELGHVTILLLQMVDYNVKDHLQILRAVLRARVLLTVAGLIGVTLDRVV